MQVSSVSMASPAQRLNFKAEKKNGYENPISRGTEKGLAVWGSIGGSALVGVTAAGIASCFMKNAKANKKLLGVIGAVAAVATLALTLPAKLYNTSVRAFTREKEMDVFSRDRELKSNIMEQVNDEVKDENVSLDQKINHYTTVQMANNGNGLLVKGAN